MPSTFPECSTITQTFDASYEELILPGDVLAAIHRQLQFQANRREHTFRGYLRYLLDNESKARADEAGDEDQLPLEQEFRKIKPLNLTEKEFPTATVTQSPRGR